MARNRKNRYLRVARQTAVQHGIPERLFLSMVDHESAWDPAAVSSAGALGLGQLMPGTARGLGVDPFDPKQNLDGAARYLKAQFERFGNWRDALRAYNQGPNAIDDAQAGLEYANSVLGGRSRYAKSPRMGRKPSSIATVRQPMGISAPAFDMSALANVLFSDQPDFLPYAQMVSEASAGPTNPVEPDETQPKQGRGTKTSFSGNVLRLGTSWDGTHTTDGDLRFGDWPKMSAVDIMGDPGTPVGAPEDGEIIDWGSAQGGEALYFLSDSGWLYWLGHVDDRLPVGTRVRRGEALAAISADHDAPHVHVDKKRYKR